jgi:serine/threonine protein kinase
MLFMEQEVLVLRNKFINRVVSFNPNFSSHYIYASDYYPNRDLGVLYGQMRRNLFKLNNYEKHMSEGMIKYFAIQMVHLLKYLFDENLVHGNLRPGHLLVDSKLQIKLIDFACCKYNRRELFKISENRFKVDIHYQPPEYFRKDRYVDFRDAHKIDIFSFGCTLYYLATGEKFMPEWKPDTLDDKTILTETLKKVKDIPTKLKRMSRSFIEFLQSKIIF